MRRQKEKCLLFDCPGDSICRYPSYAPLRTTKKKTDGGANFSNLHNAPLRMAEGKAASRGSHAQHCFPHWKIDKTFFGKIFSLPSCFSVQWAFVVKRPTPPFPPFFFVVAAISGGRKFREHWIRGKVAFVGGRRRGQRGKRRINGREAGLPFEKK